ncbi:SusC/RagA family TonB-linked outer membrane protein [Parapedobacter pyrenivorans]|uniref:SusC/RagA family TonB-linked outer membrane protein n=1 Tax=Parapedobacter pyrenivorans TaxID=1305674 RepID=UPI003342B2B5
MVKNRLGPLHVIALFITALTFFSTRSFAQTTIKGNVIGKDGAALSGVTVKWKNANASTLSDANGNFSIIKQGGNRWLVFSYTGMDSKEVDTEGKDDLRVVLDYLEQKLDEVLVVGYSTQSRDKTTTAISKIDTKVLENVPFSNAASALQGAVSGVQVQTTHGQPGAAPKVIVRGGTSINNPGGAQPLYIVDGVIRSSLTDVNAQDIASINVLKDAASTAIYGARGSNGVVIVETVKAKAGSVNVSYNYSHTISNPSKLYEFASAEEYINLNRTGLILKDKYTPSSSAKLALPNGYGTGNDLTKNTAFTPQYLTDENRHKLNEGWQSMVDPTDPSKTIIFKETDFQDVLYRTAQTANHHVSLMGGSESAKFNASIGYLQNEGAVITTEYDRLSLNLGGEISLSDRLKFHANSMYTNSSDNAPYNYTAIFYRSVGLPPTTKYTFEDGTLAPGQGRTIGNMAYYMNNDFNQNTNEKLSVSAGADWKIIDGLNFRPRLSLFRTSDEAYSFIPAYWDGPTRLVNTRTATGIYSKSTVRQADLLLQYNKGFLAHNFDVTAGFSYFNENRSGMSATGRDAATDLIPTLNASATPQAVSGTITEFLMLSYFGSLNYDFDNKYLITLNARYDGASNLGTDNRWGFFPGISAGWNMHNEEFWKSSSLADLLRLKLRGSYGVNGNISGLGWYQAQGVYAVQGRYGGQPSIQNTVLANNELQWERSKTLNGGIDLGLFNDRITLIADIYRRVTDNLITNLTLPPSTGFTSIATNFGSLENRGIELELSADILPVNSEVKWRASFLASKTKHKILKLPENGIENNRVGGVNIWDPEKGDYGWFGGLQEGGRIGDFYSHKQVSIYPTDEEAALGPVNTFITGNDKTSYGGFIELLDVDGNGLIDAYDQVYMGNPYPVWNGGFSSTVAYKNFEFYLRLDYTTGHTIYNYPQLFFDRNGQGDVNTSKEMATHSWKQQGDITHLPVYIPQGPWLAIYSRYYEKGDFLNIREVTLNYNIGRIALNRININNVRIYVTGNNLHYFTKYKGVNPEEGGQDNGRYPIPRNFIMGLKITL